MKYKYRLLILLFFISYACTFLPYFGFFNELEFYGPFPEPMTYALCLNALNTFFIFLIFKVFYPYFIKQSEKALKWKGR